MRNDPRLISYRKETGVANWYHFDPSEDKFTIEAVQDAQPIIEYNALQASELRGGRWGDGQLVARVPPVIVEQMRKDGIIDYNDPEQRRLKKWMNDRDNLAFRIKPGHI